MVRPKFSKKTLFVLLVVILIVAGGTVFGIKKNNGKKANIVPLSKSNSTPSEQTFNTPRKADTDQPGPADKGPAPPILDAKIPAGTIEPGTIASSPNKYFGKVLKIRGLIVDIGGGKYDVIDQSPKPNSPSLRLSSNIDLQKYSNSTSKSQGPVHFSNPVTIDGILLKPKKGQYVTLEVKAVN